MKTITTLSLAIAFAVAGSSTAQVSKCLTLNERGGNLNKRSETWDVAFEISVPRPMWINDFTLFTRSKNKGAGRLPVALHLPNSSGAPYATAHRSVFLNFKAGDAAMQAADVYSHPSGPLFVRTKFFLVLPKFYQQYAFWPDLTQGDSGGQVWQKNSSGQWVKHPAQAYLSYVFNCRSNYVRGLFSTYGRGCAGASGRALAHTATDPNFNRPELGTISTYSMANAAPRTLCRWTLGISRTSWAGLRLPADLRIIGATPGCFLNTSIDFEIPFLSRTDGKMDIRVRHSRDPNLIGISVYTMFTCFERGANGIGITTSNGVMTRLGGTR